MKADHTEGAAVQKKEDVGSRVVGSPQPEEQRATASEAGSTPSIVGTCEVCGRDEFDPGAGHDDKHTYQPATWSTEMIRALYSEIHYWLTETDDCDGIAFLLRIEERLKAAIAKAEGR